jgi:hypothetical protein
MTKDKNISHEENVESTKENNNSDSETTESLKRLREDDSIQLVKEAKKPKGFWTEEHCLEEALKFRTRNEFKIKSLYAYNASRKGKWIEKVCAHM